MQLVSRRVIWVLSQIRVIFSEHNLNRPGMSGVSGLTGAVHARDHLDSAADVLGQRPGAFDSLHAIPSRDSQKQAGPWPNHPHRPLTSAAAACGVAGSVGPHQTQGAGQCGLVFCCVPNVQVSEVCMSGLCRPVHPVRACLGKFLARCRTGVRSPAAAHAENVHPGLRCTPSGSGSARRARRRHREFSAWRCCHRFLLSDDRAALHHRDSDHERVLS